MVAKVLIKRTATPNLPPVTLDPGELSIEMANPTRLWVGVPPAQDPSGKKLLLDLSVARSGAAIISDTAPPTPLPGDLWWESDSGLLLVWYDDGSSSQWVAATVPGARGADGTNGQTGVVLTKVFGTMQASVSLPVNSASTTGVECGQADITIKNPASKIGIKGGTTILSASGASDTFLVRVYAGATEIGRAEGTNESSGVISQFSGPGGNFVHGLPAGSVIHCTMTAGHGATAGTWTAKNNWLEVEEVI